MSVVLNVIIGITIPLLLLFLVVDRKAKIPVGFLIVGFFACCIAAYLSAAIAEAYDYTSIELARYVAPVVEETIKALPIMLFILLRRPDIRTAFMAAAAVGVGFATIENIIYFMNIDVSNFGFVLIRGLSTGIMHVMTLLIVTVVLYQVMRVNALRYLVVLISVLAFATTFHGLYNLLVNSASAVAVTIGYIIPPVVAVIFLIYLLHADIGTFFARLQNRQP